MKLERLFRRLEPVKTFSYLTGIAVEVIEKQSKDGVVDVKHLASGYFYLFNIRIAVDGLSLLMFDVDLGYLRKDKSQMVDLYQKICAGFMKPAYVLLPVLDRSWNPFRRSYFQCIWDWEARWKKIIDERRTRVQRDLQNPESCDSDGEVGKGKREDLITMWLREANSEEEFFDDYEITVFITIG